jgi:hypothetical protein
MCKEKSAFLIIMNSVRLILYERGRISLMKAFPGMTGTARLELIVGNYDTCAEMTRKILRRVKTMKMWFNALMIGVQCVIAENDVEVLIAAANRALCLLGIVVPNKQ